MNVFPRKFHQNGIKLKQVLVDIERQHLYYHILYYYPYPLSLQIDVAQKEIGTSRNMQDGASILLVKQSISMLLAQMLKTSEL